MDIKWLEDLIALAQTGSLSRAAALRHVTHPAFGRRIRALENWAGVPLLDRQTSPLRLTEAGTRLLAQADQTVQDLRDVREELKDSLSSADFHLTVAAGRTLARTVVADWLTAMKPHLRQAPVRVRTNSLATTLQWIDAGEADLLFAYHHPVIAVRPSGRHFLHKTLARDKLVPVMRADHPVAAHSSYQQTGSPVPYLAYDGSLALAGLVTDHLARTAIKPRLKKVIEADSADALLEYALKGLGICWLPWSLAGGACRAGQLVSVWGRAMEIPFEVRLLRLRRKLGPLAESTWNETSTL